MLTFASRRLAPFALAVSALAVTPVRARADVVQYCTEIAFIANSFTLVPPGSPTCGALNSIGIFNPTGGLLLFVTGQPLTSLTSPASSIDLGVFIVAAIDGVGLTLVNLPIYLRVASFSPDVGFVDFVGMINGTINATTVSATISWLPGTATIGTHVYDIEAAGNQTTLNSLSPATIRASASSVSAAAEPATFALAATGLLGIVGFARRRIFSRGFSGPTVFRR